MKKSNQSQGKLNRRRGQIFEGEVRRDLEEAGWIVCKWQNTVKDGRLVHAPHKFNPFTRSVIPGSGFPDFIAYRMQTKEIIGVEAKRAKYLDKTEKEMVEWYRKNNIFDTITVAYKDKSGKLQYTLDGWDNEGKDAA